jgi:hypothetical protein
MCTAARDSDQTRESCGSGRAQPSACHGGGYGAGEPEGAGVAGAGVGGIVG